MKNLMLLLVVFPFISFASNSGGRIDKTRNCDCAGEPGYIYQNYSGNTHIDGGCIGKLVPIVSNPSFFLDAKSKICGSAEVTGKSKILNGCIITNNATFDDSSCKGDVLIGGDSVILNESKIFGGARIFGDTFLDNVIVKRNVRLNSGDYSDQTLGESYSSATQTQEEKALVAKLTNPQTQGGAGKIKELYRKMRISAVSEVYIKNFKTKLNGAPGFAKYHGLNGIPKIDENLNVSEQELCSPEFTPSKSVEFYDTSGTFYSQVHGDYSFYFDTANNYVSFNAGVNIKSDVDVNDSYIINESIGSALQNGHSDIGPKVFIYRVKLFVTLTLERRFLSGSGDSAIKDWSSSMTNVDYLDFYFNSSQARDSFISRFKAYVDGCKNL